MTDRCLVLRTVQDQKKIAVERSPEPGAKSVCETGSTADLHCATVQDMVCSLKWKNVEVKVAIYGVEETTWKNQANNAAFFLEPPFWVGKKSKRRRLGSPICGPTKRAQMSRRSVFF